MMDMIEKKYHCEEDPGDIGKNMGEDLQRDICEMVKVLPLPEKIRLYNYLLALYFS